MIRVGSCSFVRGLNREESRWYVERPNMTREEAGNGDLAVFDESSTKVVRGTLAIDYCSAAEAAALRTFLSDTARLWRFTFDIVPDAWSDVGAGVGATLEDCRLDTDGASLEGVIEPQGAFAKYAIRLPYRAIVQDLAGAWSEGG